MQAWKEYKLNELGKVGRGKSKHRPRNDVSLYGGKYPFVQTGDVKAANFYITKFSQTYNEKGLAQSKLWKPGTLCITIAANIAESAILGIDACFPDSIIGFVPDDKKSDVRFIKYHFDLLKLHLQSISQGTTQDNLSQEKLLKFVFTVPKDLKHQRHIASILSSYDELIELNNRRIKLLEETICELYKEWFLRMRFPGYKQTKFIKGVPYGWEIRKLKDFVKPQYGYTESSIQDNSLPKFLRVMDINKSSFIDWSDVPNCPINDNDFKKYQLKKDDLIIARMADPGKVAIIEQDVKAVFASYLIRLKIISKEVEPYWLFYTLGSDYFQGTFVNADSASTRGSINGPTIIGVKILLPTKNLIEIFDHTVRPFRSQISLLVEKNTQLREIRNRLLPRLISGKLEVKANINSNETTAIS